MKLYLIPTAASLARSSKRGNCAPARQVAAAPVPRPPAAPPRPKLPEVPTPVMPGEDDPDEEMRGNSAASRARRRERARCGAIFACAAAAENMPLAAHLAFNTTMTREQAIAKLQSSTAMGRAHAIKQSWAKAYAATKPARAVQCRGGVASTKGGGSPIQASWAAAFEAFSNPGRPRADGARRRLFRPTPI